MRIVYLNTSIVTSPGLWLWEPSKVDTVRAFLAAHPDVGRLSAIGHAATAAAMTELLGEAVEVNRIFWEGQIGDVAVVLKVRGRLEEGKVLSRDELESMGYEVGFLRYINSPEKTGRESLVVPWVHDADVIEHFRMVW